MRERCDGIVCQQPGACRPGLDSQDEQVGDADPDIVNVRVKDVQFTSSVE